jgi:hypothetical protein
VWVLRKYWGYFVAVGALLLTLGATALAMRYGALLDAFYPYVTRWVQTALANFSSRFSLPLWQILAVLLGATLVGTLALALRKGKGPLVWLGWVLAAGSLALLLHTALFGLNRFASPLAQDLRLDAVAISQADVDTALAHYRAQLDALEAQLPKDETGRILFDNFDNLAQKAANGFQNLVKEGYSVFAGSVQPPKKLLLPEIFEVLGIEGMHTALTGEVCVNLKLPEQALTAEICRQMSRRMGITRGQDPDFAAVLVCLSNSDPWFQYAGCHLACSALEKGNDLGALIARWHRQQTAQENQQQTKFDPTDEDYISGILGGNYE